MVRQLVPCRHQSVLSDLPIPTLVLVFLHCGTKRERERRFGGNGHRNRAQRIIGDPAPVYRSEDLRSLDDAGRNVARDQRGQPGIDVIGATVGPLNVHRHLSVNLQHSSSDRQVLNDDDPSRTRQLFKDCGGEPCPPRSRRTPDEAFHEGDCAVRVALRQQEPFGPLAATTSRRST